MGKRWARDDRECIYKDVEGTRKTEVQETRSRTYNQQPKYCIVEILPKKELKFLVYKKYLGLLQILEILKRNRNVKFLLLDLRLFSCLPVDSVCKAQLSMVIL